MSAVAASDWIAKAETIQPRNEAFIDGRYVPAASGRTYDDIAGRDGRVITQVAEGGVEDIERAVAAARASFEDRRWADMSPAKRKIVLLKLAESMRANRDELALLESLDVSAGYSGGALAGEQRATLLGLSLDAQRLNALLGKPVLRENVNVRAQIQGPGMVGPAFQRALQVWRRLVAAADRGERVGDVEVDLRVVGTQLHVRAIRRDRLVQTSEHLEVEPLQEARLAVRGVDSLDEVHELERAAPVSRAVGGERRLVLP